jgi:ferredoxin-NADP reductase
MRQKVTIQKIGEVTHDVKYFRVDKPMNYQFTPGQATDVSLDKPEMEKELRPFTFTELNDKPYLEFTIKRYADHHGVTDQLHRLQVGDKIYIGDVWGAISYKGAGCFIAGGAGITPFISILRQLHQDGKLQGNMLFFSNKTAADIIYEQELKSMLGDKAIFILSDEKKDGYLHGHINEPFIREHIKDMSQHFYICGPDQMISDISRILDMAGAKADNVIFEK